ncbi:hypothetical protein BU24DRAFT_427802 [Aaosphaeria arxii CBS 175.79]|uniref:Transcriptional regulatory protein DEP1 n=1 Tax=Aaosphaeria arxii CBS 175.79 TaxID=1450172 RepID=A0A6A5X9Q6_9PLEO|nr:uncharacterized protein BU24DRAFT_427802 [Aaosphaeria arxii CBS 175.79]KAF2009785.1 hypothetical protein BU24DRAFT_427802 [Aaosphaeria arxii CBS 175.79]
MSALQRGKRSSSNPVLGAERDVVVTNDDAQIPSTDLSNPSSRTSTPPLTAKDSLQISSSKEPDGAVAPTSPFLPVSDEPTLNSVSVNSLVGRDSIDDLQDNRSSSLSELGDASDEHSEPTPRAVGAIDLIDNDSEAETERLEQTPRKLTRTATNASLNSEQMYERTPSKLSHTKTVLQDSSVPPSPTSSVIDEVDVIDVPTDGNAALRSLSFVAASEAASLELAGKKRKRSSAETSSADETATEKRARKRTSVEADLAHSGDREGVASSSAPVDIEEEIETAGERILQLAEKEMELEARQADVATEAVGELTTVAKLSKPRKGGRRGKRKNDDIGGGVDVTSNLDSQELQGDAEQEEEDGSAMDEEASKKKTAIDELAKIERKFKIFREKLCDEQLAQCEYEMDLLKQPNCQHPEYLAMIRCIDDRRTAKIAYERQLMEYKKQSLERTTIAERHQLHSQYFQTVRDTRENILSDCNQRIYELQRGRRQYGVEDIEYAIRLPEKRSEQIRQQTAYNLEVSIISGVAKYVGFPAAPELKAARPSEIDDDFRAMKITPRPSATQTLPYVRSMHRSATADEAAAEEQFIERTPWANPQHPAHQQTHYQVAIAATPRQSNQSFQTPAGQRRIVDIHAPNGSSSTIEIGSNPPSATAHAGRAGESESPILQSKKHPGDHGAYSEVPGLHARIPSEALGDSYTINAHPRSSPAAIVEPVTDEHGSRWHTNNLRSLNPVAPAGTARQVPVSQKGSLGAINAQPLFGR